MGTDAKRFEALNKVESGKLGYSPLSPTLSRGEREQVVGEFMSRTTAGEGVINRAKHRKNFQLSTFHSQKKSAFTLAEVLITLGIIGVVAAITLPVIITKINHIVLKNQFKTAVSIINQNVAQAKINSGIDKFGEYCTYINNASYVNENECLEYLHNAMIIKGNKGKYKFHIIDRGGEELLTYNGKLLGTTSSDGVAADGYGIRYTVPMPNGMYLNYNVNGLRLNIAVDINGTKKPNRFGHDIFLFYIDNTNDKLTGLKQNREYTDEELDNMNFEYEWQRAHKGTPCNLNSSSKANGIGCGWYALADMCPYDNTKKYFECLPR